MNKIQSILVMLCGGVWALASAATVGQASIPAVTTASDLILVGEVLGVEVVGIQGTMTLSPIEIIKGSIPQGPVRIDYQGFGVDNVNNLKSKRALLFVKRDAETKAFVLVPLRPGGALPLEYQVLATDLNVPVPAALRLADSDSELQKVVKTLGLVYLTSPGSEAFLHLDTLISFKSEPELTKLIYTMQQQSLRADGMTKGTVGLLRLGGIEGLESVDQASGKMRDDLQKEVNTLESTYQDKSSNGVAILTQWLNGQRPAERYAAAGALARIHTRDAILVLGPALDDPDFEIRWRAIGGLSLFANNVAFAGGPPAPGAWPFRNDETIRYSVFDREFLVKKGEDETLGFWRKWWAQNRAGIEGLVE